MNVLIRDDFDLGKIAASGQAFRVAERGDTYRFITGRRVLHIRRLTPCRYEVDCTRDGWQRHWRPYFDLGRSYAAVREGIPEDDPWLRDAALQGAGIRILRQDPWEMLITFIISQRRSIPAIKTCVEALCARFGEELPLPDGETLHAFPTARALAAAPVDEIAACGLGYRTPYVRAAAERAAAGALDLKALANLDDAALLERLGQEYGVGVKVANCVALFGYGRIECAPVDVWIQRVIDTRYGGLNPFPRYGNAGILQQYMFYAARRGVQRSRRNGA